MVKLIENAYRDVNIAYANELSMICENLDIDVWEAIDLANKHPRVSILKPGPGVGGHCIAVDPWFIVHKSPEAVLIRTAREVNMKKERFILDKVIAKAEKFNNPVIGILGLAFKADIDDLRESPAVAITIDIIKAGLGEVYVCEPNVKESAVNVKNCEIDLSPLDVVLKKADILVILVDHKQFKKLSHTISNEKIIIDTRGIIR